MITNLVMQMWKENAANYLSAVMARLLPSIRPGGNFIGTRDEAF